MIATSSPHGASDNANARPAGPAPITATSKRRALITGPTRTPRREGCGADSKPKTPEKAAWWNPKGGTMPGARCGFHDRLPIWRRGRRETDDDALAQDRPREPRARPPERRPQRQVRPAAFL